MPKLTPPCALVFDLDGTLIDSAPSILAGFRAAFASTGLTPALAFAEDLIGPPLRDTLRLLLGRDDPAQLDALVDAFKTGYDADGYRASRPYPGIGDWLADLAGQGVAMYLATNKRWVPTALILDHLGWRQHFEAVHALDGPAAAQPSKGELLRWMLGHYQLDASAALYVGDRDEDAGAARHAGMPFERVPWGYGGAHAAVDKAVDEAAGVVALRSACERWLKR
jgi:phosphoglycolate phosphatase